MPFHTLVYCLLLWLSSHLFYIFTLYPICLLNWGSSFCLFFFLCICRLLCVPLFHSIYIYCLHFCFFFSAPRSLFTILYHSLHPSLMYYFSIYIAMSTESLSPTSSTEEDNRRLQSLTTSLYPLSDAKFPASATPQARSNSLLHFSTKVIQYRDNLF